MDEPCDVKTGTYVAGKYRMVVRSVSDEWVLWDGIYDNNYATPLDVFIRNLREGGWQFVGGDDA